MLEKKIKTKSSWSTVKSNFVADGDYLDELGLDEKLKKEIKNE